MVWQSALLMASLALWTEGGSRALAGARRVPLEDGSIVEVEAGEIEVPESRQRASPRRVTIPYYRLKSTSPTPASPIFLLAGGPGSSWLDQFESEEHQREVQFYRTIADVVLFDQRGGGHSRPAMDCPGSVALRPDAALDFAALREPLREALAACRDRWLAAGVDLAAYNTLENAADVNDLRLALGYPRVTLIGGSYGSHLALAVMRQFPQTVDRAVLFGVEGPDHTWDDPGATLATLERIARHAEGSAQLAGRIPPRGLLEALERVVARLEALPRTVTVGSGESARPVMVDANVVRRMARAGAGRRKSPNAWPEMILALERGDYSAAAEGRLDNLEIPLARPVHYSMDCASGISGERRRRYDGDPAAFVLGDLNFEYRALCDLWPSADLGSEFRRNVESDVPTLIVHGTWDLSTPIENAREVARSLRNSQLLEVIGGSHSGIYNLYQRWPPIFPLLREFLAGGRPVFPPTVDDLPTATQN